MVTISKGVHEEGEERDPRGSQEHKTYSSQRWTVPVYRLLIPGSSVLWT